jgi:hypothetical protein
MDGRVIDRNASLDHLLKIARTQIVGNIPAYTQRDHRLVELAVLEHPNSPKIFDSFLAMR